MIRKIIHIDEEKCNGCGKRSHEKQEERDGTHHFDNRRRAHGSALLRRDTDGGAKCAQGKREVFTLARGYDFHQR